MRAAVWKGTRGGWWAETCPAEDYEEGASIYVRVPVAQQARLFPTHAEALAHALAEVGLTEKNGDTA